MRSRLLAAIAVGLLAATALAQDTKEPARPDVVAPEPPPATPRPSLRVLQHPYEISAFYRAGGSAFGPWAGLPNDPSYRIAGFYRAHEGGYPQAPQGWSAFWTSGYSAPRPAPFPGYRRTIGENGDLFLLVPFLAPVGPIGGAFAGY